VVSLPGVEGGVGGVSVELLLGVVVGVDVGV
jgi:hypothetical protein